MTKLPHLRSLVAAVAVLLAPVAAGVHPAMAQSAPGPAPAPERAEKRALAPSLPKTPAERDTVLSELYAQLAVSADEDAAKAVAENIERVWLYSGSPTVDLLFGRAMLAVAEKNYARALKFLDHVVEQAPDFAEGWSRRAFVHFQLNNVTLALGDLRRALALDPSHFKALDGLAQVLRDIGEKKAALMVFRRLAEVHPYWSGTEQAIGELSREVEGQGI
jgi:tetratricopeptide (TPR) repeat protein